MKIGIIGGGKWGLALRKAMMEKNEVYLTSRRKKDVANFVSAEEILENEYLLFVISAQYAREWMEKNFVFSNQKILVASKGIEDSSNQFLGEIFSKFLPKENLAYLSGPSFAVEVLNSLPTAVMISSQNPQLSQTFSSFFPDFIKTYCDDDMVGAEICGAYKNIIAIASGICDGLKLGNNARASLISRGLVEMQRFGLHFEAKEKTFLGLSGAGDLFLTASSPLSRNYRVGFALASGKKLDEILKDLGEVAEGVRTAKAITSLSEKYKIYTPIATEVQNIISGKNPKDSLKDLLKKN